MAIDFTKRFNARQLQEFADMLLEIQSKLDFKVSSRGWCYLMEQYGHINKSQFNKIEDNINRCRREGLIPVDFVAEEDARMFSGVEEPTDGTVEGTLAWMLRDVLNGSKYFTPDWWEGEEYYVQMLVEKIDLKTLFEPVCKEYHVPIANAKGWSSILQRGEYARRFKEAQDKGLKCVLLYCGDHDPDGLRISDTIRKNLEQISNVIWKDGETGFDPEELIIERFGLNYDYIIDNKLTWIDNLITGSGKDLSSTTHVNFKMPYVQEYLKKVGRRKCEANVIVTTPKTARQLVRDAIEGYVGKGAKDRFAKKREKVEEDYLEVLTESGLATPIRSFLNK